MSKITVKFYKTVQGRDRLIKTQEFETLQEAQESVEEWEERTLDNYAVYS